MYRAVERLNDGALRYDENTKSHQCGNNCDQCCDGNCSLIGRNNSAVPPQNFETKQFKLTLTMMLRRRNTDINYHRGFNLSVCLSNPKNRNEVVRSTSYEVGTSHAMKPANLFKKNKDIKHSMGKDTVAETNKVHTNSHVLHYPYIY